MSDQKQLWIDCGYALFAAEGPQGLKIEVLARQVGKSKSSFYHYFADLEVFTSLLLERHLERSRVIVNMERACERVIPDLLQVLIEVKEDLFFNRQLRINRDVPAYRTCFEQSSKDVGEAVLGIWAEALGLEGNTYLTQLVLNLSLENFYLQITPETMTYDWLHRFVLQLQQMVTAFKNSQVLDTQN